MNRFRFEATDDQGRKQTGVIEAGDRDEAQGRLIGRGWTVLNLEAAEARSAGRTSPLSEREVTELLEQLHAMTRSGLPLPSGLRAAGSELETGELRVTFNHLADHLEQGVSLDSALVAEANRFPAHLQGLVLAGVRTGRLADVLGEVVQGGNLGQELRRKVWASIAYPVMVLSLVVGLVFVICHLAAQSHVGLSIRGALLDFGVAPQTSASAEAVQVITQFVADHDLWIIAGLAGALVASYLTWRFALSPPRRQRFLESIPLIGPMIRFVALAEFCHLTALLIEAEVPLPEALNLAGASVRDPALAEACGLMASSVAEGQTLTSALQLWTTLPAGLGQLLAWGEEGQDLDEALRFAADMFETRAEVQATFAGQVLGALLLLLILWWIGFAVAAIYLPITDAMRGLSRLV